MPPLFWRQIIRDFVVLLLSQTPTATRLGACNGDASLQRLLHDSMILQFPPLRVNYFCFLQKGPICTRLSSFQPFDITLPEFNIGTVRLRGH
jgi:hypothetical protein